MVSDDAEELYERYHEEWAETELGEPHTVYELLDASEEHLDSAHVLKENDPTKALGQQKPFTVSKAMEMYASSYREMKSSLEELSSQPSAVEEERFLELRELANRTLEVGADIVNDTPYSGEVSDALQYAENRFQLDG